MDLLKGSSDDIIESYFEKICDKMRNATTPFISIKIGNRFFKERKIQSKDSLPVFANKFQTDWQMMQLMIEEINRYSAFINGKVREEMKAAEEQEKAFDDSNLH